MTDIEDKARKIGAEHGRNAASWVFDGNTTQESYRIVLTGIEEGDPLIMDTYSPPSLMFTMHADDGYTEGDLADDLNLDIYDNANDATLEVANDAYRLAASESFWHEVERMAREALA